MKLLLVFLWIFWTKGWSLFGSINDALLFFSPSDVCLCFSAGPVPQRECVLSPVNNSHPVHALLESFTVLSGCASRGTTSLPQEVHVLNLRNPKEGLGHHEREVKGKLLFLQIPGDKYIWKWDYYTLICCIKLILSCQSTTKNRVQSAWKLSTYALRVVWINCFHA